jgi:hypothetical protein
VGKMRAISSAALRRHPRKVFGIGLHKTGTSSLNTALRLLGLRPAHFPFDPRTQQESLALLASGGDRVRLTVLRYCDGLIDLPGPAIFEALDAAYPGSRFILTVRDREAWLRSCGAFWPSVIEPYLLDHPREPFSIYLAAAMGALYGLPTFDREQFSHAYDAHMERVTCHFRGRENDLLVLDICSGDGWPQLCGFLGRPIPDLAFPFENRTGTEGSARHGVAAIKDS